ncbi:hypothetical protein D6821_02750 [Candidatus Parcubacteria bacterium]|nr:MAG: hypothetical protein D6821_02750 [Candidatus Parcubacteria bacterium]
MVMAGDNPNHHQFNRKILWWSLVGIAILVGICWYSILLINQKVELLSAPPPSSEVMVTVSS